LMFAAGQSSSLQFVQAVNALSAAGAQIIVDDLSFLSEPFFEDGLTAQRDRVVGAQVLRISSAGNYGLAHYRAVFNQAVLIQRFRGHGTTSAAATNCYGSRFRAARQPKYTFSGVIRSAPRRMTTIFVFGTRMGPSSPALHSSRTATTTPGNL